MENKIELHEAHNYTLFKSNSMGVTTCTEFTFIRWADVNQAKAFVNLPNKRGTFSIPIEDCIIIQGPQKSCRIFTDFQMPLRNGQKSFNGNASLNLCHQDFDKFEMILRDHAFIVGEFDIQFYHISNDKFREENPSQFLTFSNNELKPIQFHEN